MSAHGPDPVLSASIFTDRPLDAFLAEVVRPFWTEIRDDTNGQVPFVWFLRYARGGHHLKLRVHGPEARREEWSDRLHRRADVWLAKQETERQPLPAATTTSFSSSRTLPAIDGDELHSTEGSPSGLTWTTYSRRDLVLGDRRFLHDDDYVRLFTGCLGRGIELHFARWDDAAASRSRSFRQGLLVRLVGRGTAAVWADPADRRRYLAYHRDWLIRFPVLHSSWGARRARGILDLYAREAEQSRAILPRIAAMSEATSDDTDVLEELWLDALRALRSHVARRARSLEGFADPFAPDIFSPILLRLFHNLANALGFNATTEGLLYHLLLQTLEEPRRDDEILLLPEERTLSSIREALSYTEEIELFQFNDAYDWWSLIADSSSGGREWAHRYRDECRPASALLKQAIQLLRQKRLAEGAAVLAEAEAVISPLERQDPVTYHVLRRFLLGTEAYRHYLRGDHEDAERAMSGVGDAIRSAVELDRGLLPLAAQAADVPLKAIKIARARYDWAGMTAHSKDLLDLLEDRTPLCRLSDGTAVTHAAIGQYLRQRLPADGPSSAAIAYLLEPRRRLVWLRRNLEILYAQTGSFIWYSPPTARQRPTAPADDEIDAATSAAPGAAASGRPSPPEAARAPTPA